jgi:C1A family cysteine protease
MGEPIPRSRSVTAPSAYDLRNVAGKNFITAIKDQGSCGSCVAFACVAATEGTWRVQANDPNLAVDLSEAHLFYCHGSSVGRTCDNGWIPNEALDMFRDDGVVDESCYPYTDHDQDCTGRCGDWESRLTRITGAHQIAARSDMKEWIATKGPLTACFVVFDDFFSYTSGVYRHVTGESAGGHAVAIIGYDDTEGCWICKNSWGTGWGDSGFFRIAYGECEIDTWQVCAVDGVAQAEWQNNRTIRGLWAISDTRNAWAYVDGLGWRRIAYDSDVIMATLLVQLAAAKAAGRPVNVHVKEELIDQVYVL